MGHYQRQSFVSRVAASAAGLYLPLARLGLLGMSWITLLGGAAAIANTALPTDAPPPPQTTADDIASACGPLPIDAYVPHDSAPLKHAFCELLAFSPFSFSSGENLLPEIVPGSVVSNDAPSPEKMTLPSFWWSRNSLPRQFGSYRLVDSWASYEIRTPAIRVIDVYVNPQIWRILQYPERYGAMNHLAEEARAAQYNLRLYSNSFRNPRLIGLYVCDFPSSNPAVPGNVFDATENCVALVDADSISRLQASLESPEEVAQPIPEAAPSENSVVGASPLENQPQTSTSPN